MNAAKIFTIKDYKSSKKFMLMEVRVKQVTYKSKMK